MTATFLLLTIGSSAVAQTGTAKRQEPLPAPVGHRQPRADQIPQDKDPVADAEKRQDAELDRKIKSICRGC
jgi:hypothetical protein